MKRYFLAVLISTALLAFIYQQLVHTSHTDQVNILLKEKEQQIQLAYAAVKISYQKAATAYFDEAVMHTEILDILAQAPHATNNEKAILRGQLYRLLWPTYQRKLRPIGIRQFHFHLPNGDSFMRFHSPEENGDNLMDIRTSIRKANVDKEIIFGFEGGRIYPGFRHVFPISYKGTHLGSVEISNSFEALSKEFAHLIGDTKLSLIMKKKITSQIAFSHHLDYFAPSFFSYDYLMENESLSKLTQETLSSALVQTTHHAFSKDHDLTAQLDEGLPFSLYKRRGSQVYAVHFIPIKDTNDQLAAYVVGYNSLPRIAQIIDQHMKMLVFGFIGIFILGITTFIMLQNRHQTLEQKRYIETIANTMESGLFVLGHNGKVDYINHTACKLLGYSKEELLKKDIHHMVHVHNDEDTICPILNVTKTGEPYSGEEVFRAKNGSTFSISVNTSSLYDEEENRSIGSVTIFRNITKEIESRKEIHQLAYFDALTKVPNRKLFFDRLELSRALSERQQSFGGLIYLDLDNLKTVNDTLGHQVGDQLLIQVTGRLLSHIRNSDTLARLGGDEFVILLNNLGKNKEEASEALENITQKILKALQRPCKHKDSRFNCYASIGGVLFIGTLEDENQLLKKADQTMYKAKNAGKNQYILNLD